VNDHQPYKRRASTPPDRSHLRDDGSQHGLDRRIPPWRVALYRVSVDGGMLLGPVLTGLLTARHTGVLPAALIVVMVTLATALLARPRATAPSP
jgi:hypothetical protein